MSNPLVFQDDVNFLSALTKLKNVLNIIPIKIRIIVEQPVQNEGFYQRFPRYEYRTFYVVLLNDFEVDTNGNDSKPDAGASPVRLQTDG